MGFISKEQLINYLSYEIENGKEKIFSIKNQNEIAAALTVSNISKNSKSQNWIIHRIENGYFLKKFNGENGSYFIVDVVDKEEKFLVYYNKKTAEFKFKDTFTSNNSITLTVYDFLIKYSDIN